MKIVVLDGYTLNPGDLSWDGIKEFGELTVHDRTGFSADNVIETIGDADIVFTNKTPIPKSVLEKTPSVKYIGVLATGYNVVDTIAAKEMGIIVTNIPTYGTSAVAQFTFALLLELCHHAGSHSEAVRNGEWTKSADFCFWNYPLIELAGKNMGLIGLGRIGQATAKIAQSFGLNVLATDSYQNPSFVNDTCKYVSLDELLANSDIISLHCPLSDSTKGIINKNTISKMKDGVMIINTARGPLVDEQDLCDALNSGKVAGAAVDVVSAEPIAATNPLLKAKNCIITPHIAWAPKESRTRLMNIAAENLSAYAA
ncbi:MAG: D-2-hydroxyacid dehydrogenase, partial [Bacteroidales bacterium]|nr:D-2-hydroxyacid dehydrogenase [Bacteroidales bacterium]